MHPITIANNKLSIKDLKKCIGALKAKQTQAGNIVWNLINGSDTYASHKKFMYASIRNGYVKNGK